MLQRRLQPPRLFNGSQEAAISYIVNRTRLFVYYTALVAFTSLLVWSAEKEQWKYYDLSIHRQNAEIMQVVYRKSGIRSFPEPTRTEWIIQKPLDLVADIKNKVERMDAWGYNT
jgi:hypothetical protein